MWSKSSRRSIELFTLFLCVVSPRVRPVRRLSIAVAVLVSRLMFFGNHRLWIPLEEEDRWKSRDLVQSATSHGVLFEPTTRNTNNGVYLPWPSLRCVSPSTIFPSTIFFNVGGPCNFLVGEPLSFEYLRFYRNFILWWTRFFIIFIDKVFPIPWNILCLQDDFWNYIVFSCKCFDTVKIDIDILLRNSFNLIDTVSVIHVTDDLLGIFDSRRHVSYGVSNRVAKVRYNHQ